MKKIVLTSMFAICVAMPAMATSYTAGESASCNNSVLGAYTGPVSATANFSIISYTCAAGTYLPADGIECEQCPANSYCGGDTYQYNQSSAQGATACPSGYTSSDAGASTQGQCYRTCTTADVAHSISVSGKFYQDQTNACEPANENACVNGYHYVAAFNASTMATTIGTGEASGYTSNDYEGSDVYTKGMSNDIIANDPMAFAVDYGNNKGMIKGHGRCSTQEGTNNDYTWSNPTTFTTLTDETNPNTGGRYCYCHVESYTLNGATQSLSSPWVFPEDFSGAGSCASSCAYRCADRMRSDSSVSLLFRSAVFGSIQSGPAQCSANEITINWGGYGANNDQNETNTCTYDGTLTAPSTAPTKKGYTFTGWTFGNQ